MNYKKLIKISVSILLTILLIWLLYSQISIKDLTFVFQKVSYKYLLFGLLLYFFIFFLRVIRMNIFLENKIRLRRLFVIMSLHNFFVNVIPARLGELSYIYMIRKTNSVDMSRNIFSLLVTRLIDAYGLLVFFLIFVLLLNPIPDLIQKIAIICFIFLVITSFLLMLLLLYRQKFFNVINHIIHFVGFGDSPLIQKILQKLENVIESFKILKDKKILFKVIFLTLFINLLMYFIVYIVLLAFDTNFGLMITFVGSGIAGFTNILPIQGVMNFGTFEGGWTLGFLLLGIQKELAIVTGFVYHITISLYMLLLSIFGLINKLIRKLA